MQSALPLSSKEVFWLLCIFRLVEIMREICQKYPQRENKFLSLHI
jgi:hypothetical protein